MDLNLRNKLAVVCGSTQGIGRATAIELAELGASVVLLARNPDKLSQTLKVLPKKEGASHAILAADFANPDNVREAITAFARSATTHILVNNTGGPTPG